MESTCTNGAFVEVRYADACAQSADKTNTVTITSNSGESKCVRVLTVKGGWW